MIIRPIQHSDVDEVVRLVELFYDEMNFDSYGYRFDKQHITKGFHRASNEDSSICYVAEIDGELSGVVAFTLATQTWCFTDRLTATEIVWHSDPRCKPFLRAKMMNELLRTALLRIKEIGCRLVIVSTPIASAVAAKLLTKYGFNSPQMAFVKEL